jgi:FAD/FMN-containing dehydrogenase/Fe-S oxidoreductase
MDQNETIRKLHSGRNIDVESVRESLRQDLEAALKGEVRFDRGNRMLYVTDASNYRMEPIGVVIPQNENDIIKTVEIARKYNVPILARGGGTSLAGQCTNIALVMDMSKYYHGVIEVLPEQKLARVLPGTVTDNLNKKTLEYGLRFGPDPATHNHNTIGGMIGNNSCGIHSVLAVKRGKGARTSDNLHSMRILTYDGLIMEVGPTTEEELDKIISEGGRKGEIYASLKSIRDKYAHEIRKRYPHIPRRVSGYNLDEFLPENGFNVARALAGTEGTCITILEATVELVTAPVKRGLMIVGFPDIFDAGHHVPELMKLAPIGLEGMDQELIHFMQQRGLHTEYLSMLPKGKGWLLVEFEGKDKKELDETLKKAKSFIEKKKNVSSVVTFDQDEKEEHMWKIRESGLGATAFVKGRQDSWPGWEDSAVSPDKVGDYLKDLRDLFNKYGYHPSLYGHFGQGCVHCRVGFDLVTEEGLKNYKSFVEEATTLVKSYGGSYSGEHGDGQARAEFLQKMYGPVIMKAFHEFKYTWDPLNKMNPGRVIDPDSVLANLRLGPEYNPWKGKTYYSYPDDEHEFSRAVLRCVGVGECRKERSGTMCPSYMVTMEEKYCTRGRAHLMFEMTRGSFPGEGWKVESIKEALEYCLSCKGCKAECPVYVDVATYKSEFMAHYYEDTLHPFSEYLFGYIKTFALIGSKIPRISNWILRAPLISTLVKKIAGIAAERDMPRLANETFKKWFFKQNNINNNIYKNINNNINNISKGNAKRVIFWVDTFNNYFHTEVAKAAAEVLKDAGWHIIVSGKNLCCGRPLYDFGMIDTAKKWLREIISEFREEIRMGTPMVGIEPSCVTTFKDELTNLLPGDEDAVRLSKQTYMFSDFMIEKCPDYKLPEIFKKALVHIHCHHKAVIKTDKETELLKKLKLDYRVVDSGCCGMAGPFGFEAKKYDISVKAGERVLLPEVRNAANDEIIIADGFSCKEQIRQLTSRKALHVAEVIRNALKNGSKV